MGVRVAVRGVGRLRIGVRMCVSISVCVCIGTVRWLSVGV